MSTMNDPVRLVSDPSRPEAERDLLRLGRSIEPPRDAEAQVWRGVIGAIGASTATTTAATKVKAAGSTTAKLTGIAIAVAALVALGSVLVGPGKAPRPSPVVAPAPAVAPPATAPTLPPTGEAAPWGETPPSSDTGPPAPIVRRKLRAPSSRLPEETTLIKEARQALREGDAPRALRVLETCRRAFPAGVLEQERDRLVIEALVKDGRASEASARAGEFLRKYPDSPHAGDVRALGRGAPGGR